ncbi:LysE family translocator [Paracoccus homiensis]|uniref:Threonine/homoserine/homoserine lactone efflux protein n=1 Tax=Paracoccus homiensis TaxID=364199 RepID=A0A1I0FHL0_9RHOB|nr:LysE family translocator [Paracoccus homiensis]SET57496.1 Threonine/homoserine/homoserine lactone efflux protein [Paracoccus homiensis]
MIVTVEQLALFVSTLAVAILSPGPGVIAVSQSAFSMGRRRALPYGWGLALGASLWCLFSLLGLTVLFRILPWTFVVLKVLGGAYLVWIAWKMWRGAPDPLPDPAESRRGTGFLGGLILNLSNPKPALFYSAVLLSIFPAQIGASDKAAIYATALTVEMSFYTGLACLMALPLLRRRYYAAKLWIDRVAAALIGALGLSLILRH